MGLSTKHISTYSGSSPFVPQGYSWCKIWLGTVDALVPVVESFEQRNITFDVISTGRSLRCDRQASCLLANNNEGEQQPEGSIGHSLGVNETLTCPFTVPHTLQIRCAAPAKEYTTSCYEEAQYRNFECFEKGRYTSCECLSRRVRTMRRVKTGVFEKAKYLQCEANTIAHNIQNLPVRNPRVK